MKLAKKWKICLIHQSHTDIGYTDPQERIAAYHVSFIEQAIDILDEIYKKHGHNTGFKWQCENYWQIENFYEQASDAQKQKFESFVKSGDIGLSGNYLNMTELASDRVVRTMLAKVKNYSQSLGINIKSAMSADVNGYSWGFCDQLLDTGVENLISCIHTHHGMFPLYKKQTPFLWEAPSGKTLFAWVADHYHLGNELFLVPHGEMSYAIQDEFSALPEAFNPVDVACTRITRYLKNLEQENYEFDFVPITVSGAVTDNAYPNMGILERAKKITEQTQIDIEMSTLDDFFTLAKARIEDNAKDTGKNIPIHKGDWNDWWADGVGSTPNIVKLYRDAERKLELFTLLQNHHTDGSQSDKELLDSAIKNMMLYAEHTWGYHASVSDPCSSMVNELEQKKSAHAINANSMLTRLLGNTLKICGERLPSASNKKKYKIMNPFGHSVEGCVKLVLYPYERIGDKKAVQVPGEYFEVIDCATNQPLFIANESGKSWQSDGFGVYVHVSLAPNETKTVSLRFCEVEDIRTSKNFVRTGADGISDIAGPNDQKFLETEQFCIELKKDLGICSIIYKKDGTNIIRKGCEYPAFSGIYEYTPVNSDVCGVRRNMGRNRKSSATLRYGSVFSRVKLLERGYIYNTVQLDYELKGARFYTVILKIYNKTPQIDALVRLHKNSEVAPENVYVSLPFTTGETETKYIDKSGCIMRPGIDQLPGSNQEFYLLQNGMCISGEKKSLVLSIKDAPLIVLGGLEASPIQLCNGQNADLNASTAYSWVMNNFWETNFKLDLGGFYEFAYMLGVYEETDPKILFEKCKQQSVGLVAIKI